MARREDLLTTRQMAQFAARGFLRFDALVPDDLNRQFLAEVEADRVPVVPAGVPLAEAYPEGSSLRKLIELPQVQGVIESLVGPASRFDHHFLHSVLPPAFFEERGWRQTSQPTHQDSTIDRRFAHFDIQLLYFPHAVTREMGGTRFVPGTHLRKVSEAAIGRYQNIRGQQHVVCPAGSLFVFHHGIWHGGGLNQGDERRIMFKIRLNPTQRQCRLWNTDDLTPDLWEQRPIFWTGGKPDPEHIHSILTQTEPWFEADVGRLEIMNHIRFWRALLGDEEFDADYWLTRVENEPDSLPN